MTLVSRSTPAASRKTEVTLGTSARVVLGKCVADLLALLGSDHWRQHGSDGFDVGEARCDPPVLRKA
jgi:hypothetical protein